MKNFKLVSSIKGVNYLSSKEIIYIKAIIVYSAIAAESLTTSRASNNPEGLQVY